MIEPHECFKAAHPLSPRFGEIFSPELPSADRFPSCPGSVCPTIYHKPILGEKRFLTEAQGSGYWTSCRLSDHFALAVGDATYRQNQWISVQGWRFFKLRLVLAGQLLGADGELLATGPQALLYLSSGTNGEGYFIRSGQRSKIIVLSCRAELLEQTLSLDSTELPSPFDTMTVAGSSSTTYRLGLSAVVRHAAERVFDLLPGALTVLRAAYLKSITMTILCEVFSEFLNREVTQDPGSHLSERDAHRIERVRGYLAQHFTAPPTIPQLARMAGVNQSKLKADFKRCFGRTVYQYILERRMDLASELLMEREHNVAEVAYRVGYKYPTNFTIAFKKHFGCLPRAWKNTSRYSAC